MDDSSPTPSPPGGAKKKNAYNTNRIKRKKNGSWIRWPILVVFLTFATSFSISFLSELAVGNAGVEISIVIVLIIIAVSIVTDVIGTAAASCDIGPFLSMASRRMRGAKRAVSLVKNNEKVSSICSDIIGDICGIVSGACGAAISLELFNVAGAMGFFGGILVSSVIAALTVGGKAFCKKLAITYNHAIIFFVAKVLSLFSKR